jgi:hypothetical protein
MAGANRRPLAAPNAVGRQGVARSAAGASTSARATYRCSPEHKTHPGTWGVGQWHPRRRRSLTACPTDIVSDAIPQGWLDQAMTHPWSWDAHPDDPGHEPPRHVYWFVPERGTFFVARRTQLGGAAGQGLLYKGHPVSDEEAPRSVVDAFRTHDAITDEVGDRLRRARRRASEAP